MKSRALFTIALIAWSCRLVLAQTEIETVDTNDDAWMEWRVKDSQEPTFVSPGLLIENLAKVQSLEWLRAQAQSYPDSSLVQSSLARRLWLEGERDESLSTWSLANQRSIDVLLESAYFFYREDQWGRALELLAQAGPKWFQLQSGVLRNDPALNRLMQAGWSAESGQAVIRNQGTTIKLLDLGAKAYESAILGSESSLFDQDTGHIGLPQIGILLEVEPISEVDNVASILSGPQGVKQELGQSVKGRPIVGHWLGSGPETVVYFGAFHGDEPESAELLKTFISHLREHPDLLEGRRAVIVPIVNPDGLALAQRQNANQVDLNRNFPTSNWNSEGKDTDYWGGFKANSEPETRVVVDVLKRFKPSRIISVHCPYRCVNYDGPAEQLAQSMSAENGYKVEASIGYPTPGSFGTYSGIEKKIPTITLELPPTGTADVWKENKSALVQALRGSKKL